MPSGCLTYQLLPVYSARWQHFPRAEEGRVEVLAAQDSRLLLPVPVLADGDGEDDNGDDDDGEHNKEDDEEGGIIIVVGRLHDDNCQRHTIRQFSLLVFTFKLASNLYNN